MVTNAHTATGDPADDTSTVSGMLAALVKRGGPKVQAMYDGLTAMGYVPAIPDRWGGKQRQRYLGWCDPARPPEGTARYTLGLEARTVFFGRKADRRAVSELPGADNSPGAYVAFRLTEPDGVAHALAAARKLKR